MDTHWAGDLSTFLTAIWAEMGDFTHSRGGYPGLVSLATISDSGPQQRQLVLRSVDRAADLLMLHTDSHTPKCAQLLADPRVSLLFWNPEVQLQIRVNGRAELLGAYAAQSAWAELPFASRGNYGVTPAPGSPIDAPFEYERKADETRLAVISVKVEHIDAVHLSTPKHIRAKFRADDNWAGQWLAP